MWVPQKRDRIGRSRWRLAFCASLPICLDIVRQTYIVGAPNDVCLARSPLPINKECCFLQPPDEDQHRASCWTTPIKCRCDDEHEAANEEVRQQKLFGRQKNLRFAPQAPCPSSVLDVNTARDQESGPGVAHHSPRLSLCLISASRRSAWSIKHASSVTPKPASQP